MASGTVKWFNEASDYGFIVPDEAGKDLYVRGGNIDPDLGAMLIAGDRVEFRTRIAGMGPEAIDVLPARAIEIVEPDAACARQELRCRCGYGIVAGAPLPTCPMCGASAWAELPWRAAGDRRKGHE